MDGAVDSWVLSKVHVLEAAPPAQPQPQCPECPGTVQDQCAAVCQPATSGATHVWTQDTATHCHVSAGAGDGADRMPAPPVAFPCALWQPGNSRWYLGPLGLALSLRATGFLICPLSRKGTALPGALAASKHHHTPQRTGTLLRGGTSRTFG